MTLTVGSLFSGIGGLELGLERAGMRTVWQVEKDEYCRRVLAKHWPDVQRFEDVRDVGAHNLPPVDLICGGFPCQDVSDAGKGAGLAGEKSGLWREFARIIRELRPKYALVENVTALTYRGLGSVLADLAERGYDAAWDTFPAGIFGAPHIRQRTFILGVLSDSAANIVHSLATVRTGWTMGQDAHSRGSRAGTWWEAEPAVGRVDNGLPNGLHRRRGLGNAVVPQVAEFIGRLIVEADASVEAA